MFLLSSIKIWTYFLLIYCLDTWCFYQYSIPVDFYLNISTSYTFIKCILYPNAFKVFRSNSCIYIQLKKLGKCFVHNFINQKDVELLLRVEFIVFEKSVFERKTQTSSSLVTKEKVRFTQSNEEMRNEIDESWKRNRKDG